jgi:hypothetical protein
LNRPGFSGGSDVPMPGICFLAVFAQK